MFYPNINPFQGMRTNVNNTINWVQGIEGAKAYVLTAKENVVLMDSESDDTFFIKICDDIGRCTLRKFKYQEEITETQPATQDLSEYVKKSELQALLNEMLGGPDESTVQRTQQNGTKHSGSGKPE